MSEKTRKYLYLSLFGSAAVLLIAGAVMLGLATSFEGYVSALLLWALAGCGLVGAQEVRQWQPRARPPTFSPSPGGQHISESEADAGQEHPSAADGR